MEREPVEVQTKPAQEIVENVVKTIETIAIKGKSTDPDWADRFGTLKPDEFCGFNSVVAHSLTRAGKYYHPEFPLASIRLFMLNKTGRKQVKYIITKEGEGLRIDRYDSFWTRLDEQQKNLLKERVIQLDNDEIEKLRMKYNESYKIRDEDQDEREEVQEQERQLGLSFVGQNEAIALLRLLIKISQNGE